MLRAGFEPHHPHSLLRLHAASQAPRTLTTRVLKQTQPHVPHPQPAWALRWGRRRTGRGARYFIPDQWGRSHFPAQRMNSAGSHLLPGITGKTPGPLTEVCPLLCDSNLLIHFFPRMKNPSFLSMVINFPKCLEIPPALAAFLMLLVSLTLLQGRLLCFSSAQATSPALEHTQKTRSTAQTQLWLHQQEGEAPAGLLAGQTLLTHMLREQRAPRAQDEDKHRAKRGSSPSPVLPAWERAGLPL